MGNRLALRRHGLDDEVLQDDVQFAVSWHACGCKNLTNIIIIRFICFSEPARDGCSSISSEKKERPFRIILAYCLDIQPTDIILAHGVMKPQVFYCSFDRFNELVLPVRSPLGLSPGSKTAHSFFWKELIHNGIEITASSTAKRRGRWKASSPLATNYFARRGR